MTGQPKKYNTALYLRLSRDDGVEGDSSSIQTQREMLTRYCKENGFTIYNEYVDDGVSGVSFDRPSFNRMISDIENGKINCVITKDLSRLGRNYIEAGTYVELFFPEHNVRYIALTDGVDTEKGSSLDITPFRNLLNEMYAQDISKKVKSAIHTRLLQGKYSAGSVPLGYIRDPADKNHLIIDEENAPVIRKIFDMALSGMGVKRIIKALKADKIPRPSYIRNNGNNSAADDERAYNWDNTVVREILKNAVYKCAVVGNKTQKISLKSKKVRAVPIDEQIIIESCHEAIIKPEEWELVQRLIKSRKREAKPTNPKYENIFAGIIRCPDCGYSLVSRISHRKLVDDVLKIYDYECNSYRRYGVESCSAHKISARALYDAVLEDIKRWAKMAVKDEDKLLDELSKKFSRAGKEKSKQNERDLKKAKKRLAEIDKLYTTLYESYANGKVNERNFTTLSANYETEQAEFESKIRELNEIIEADEENGRNAENFVELIKPYAKIYKLTQPIISSLIDYIAVHEPAKVDGELLQKVDIHYKLVGNLN